VALDQWAQDLLPRGIVIGYNPDGSAAGRADYIAGMDDFAASDVAFRTGQDKLGGTRREVVPYGFSYLPDVAGGTAFPYHIVVRGHLIRNLRLSARTLMKIFTGRITNWDSPQITRDYGQRLPSLPITPVLHSEGSGVTYFLTNWMAHQFPRQWDAFCERVRPGLKPPCGPTEFYPVFGSAKSENGSNNVIGYITSRYGNGSIGYDEYAYPLGARWPVARVRNPAGRYVLPIARNVTIALRRAIIDENPRSPDFLQQNLDKVYTFRNPASYPLSSYSYLIVPRSGKKSPPDFTRAKGRTLSTFVHFLLCTGQKQVTRLGYAPLPVNLVQGGLLQIAHIPGHIRGARCR
jgi:ABC-type phosphate transport system substrate-binding protein